MRTDISLPLSICRCRWCTTGSLPFSNCRTLVLREPKALVRTQHSGKQWYINYTNTTSAVSSSYFSEWEAVYVAALQLFGVSSVLVPPRRDQQTDGRYDAPQWEDRKGSLYIDSVDSLRFFSFILYLRLHKLGRTVAGDGCDLNGSSIPNLYSGYKREAAQTGRGQYLHKSSYKADLHRFSEMFAYLSCSTSERWAACGYSQHQF